MKKDFLNKAFILPVVSGILLIFTLPPFNISSLLWFFLVPLLFFIDNDKLTTKQIFQGGFIVGIIYFAKVVYPLLSLNAWWWLDITGVVYENKLIYLFWILYFSILYASVFWGVFSVLYRKLKKYNILDTLLFPAIWVLFEFIRAKTLAGFTWGHLGYALHDNIYILQSSKFFGVYGLSFLIIFVNISLYIILKKYIFLNRINYASVKLFLKDSVFYSMLLVLIFTVLYGYLSINGEEKINNKRELSISVIQFGLKTESIKKDNLKPVMEIINQALSYGPDILVLPENSFPFLVFNKDTWLPFGYGEDVKITEIYNKLLDISLEKNISLVLGLYSKVDEKKYNSIIIIEDGKVVDIYNKRILLPFSEAKLSFLKPTESLEYGNRRQILKVKNISINFLICSEIIYPNLLDNKNTELIINIGNDSVFDNPLVAQQNHIIAKIRAAENGQYLIRSMKTGISSVINPHGKAVSILDFNKKGTINQVIWY